MQQKQIKQIQLENNLDVMNAKRLYEYQAYLGG